MNIFFRHKFFWAKIVNIGPFEKAGALGAPPWRGGGQGSDGGDWHVILDKVKGTKKNCETQNSRER